MFPNNSQCEKSTKQMPGKMLGVWGQGRGILVLIVQRAGRVRPPGHAVHALGGGPEARAVSEH